ncbi:MAG: tRNA 2-selenouridine(34) synthase MnmH [Acidobacteriota bacterium]
MRNNAIDLAALFLNDVPMMDVRAPVEFGKGAFPGVVNLPLMNDSERQQVGTCYKRHGQDAAIELGHRLVSGDIKSERVAAWAAFARAHPDGYLYCFRGGLRSQIVQQWLLNEAGIAYPRVIGGYKAMRGFLIDTLQQAAAQCDFVVLGGWTGTGKTDVITQLPNGLDLEGHARHRGSSFGQRVQGQPAPIDFENALAIDVLKKRARGVQSFVVEDEGRNVGHCSIPLALRERMEKAPIVWLEDDFEARVERILRDYVVQQCADFIAVHGESLGLQRFAAQLQDSLSKIAKRLGGQRYQSLAAIMRSALDEQLQHGDVARHREWITALLQDYYDPMYAYQRVSKASRIEFTGTPASVRAHLLNRPTSAPSK